MENNLTGKTASNTYGRLVQVVDGKYYDGFGNPLNIVGPSSFVVDGGFPNNVSNGVFKIDFGGIQ